MKEQLKELLKMQKLLDEAIMKEHGLAEYPANNMEIALFVELCEMMNELPTKFKYWKKSAIDNRENALVEYVDALHFVLSLFNHQDCKIAYVKAYNECGKCNEYAVPTIYDCLINLIMRTYDGYAILNIMFKLGNILGFSWEEVYTTYKKKNAVNYERLKKGY